MTRTSTFAQTLYSGAFAVAASALILGFAAGPAQASSVIVSVSAQELSTPQGRAAIDTRINRAAKQVCDAGSSDLKAKQIERECTAETIEASRAKVAALKTAAQIAAR